MQPLLFVNRTMLALLAIGFASGVPNMLATTVAPTWATIVGWDVALVGSLSFAQLPYALKFLWAPLVDRVHLPGIGRLGRRRSWLVATQVACAAAALVLAIAGPTTPEVAPGGASVAGPDAGQGLFMLLLLVLVVASATQDLVACAFQAESLEPRQLGAGAGMFVSGYRIAFAILGAGVMIVAPQIASGTRGWSIAVAVAGLFVLIGAGAALLAREPAQSPAPPPSLRDAIVEPVAVFVRSWRWRVAALAAFVLLFRLPDQLGNPILPPLLLKGLGYDAEQVGAIRQFLGFGLTIVGALIGGWAVARLGMVTSLWISGILQAASNLVFWAMAASHGATVHAGADHAPPILTLVAGIAAESACGGMVSAVFVAFLMSLCERRLVTTQYALLTALMAASGAIGGGFGGLLAARLDYAGYFLATALAGLPGLALIPLVSRPPGTPARAPAPP